jgi:hypothetical protein
MDVSRRDFVLAGGVAAVAPSALQAQSPGRKELLQVAMVVGANKEPVRALLAMQMADRARTASKAELLRLQKRALQSSAALTATGSLKLKSISNDPFLREIGFTDALSKSLREGSLIQTTGAFTELYSPVRTSLINQAVAKVVSSTSNVTTAEASRILSAVACSLGFDGLKGASVEQLLDPSKSVLNDGLSRALANAGGRLVPEVLAPMLGLSADQVNAAASLADRFKAPGLVPGLDTFGFQIDGNAQSIRAGAAVCQLIVGIVGGDSPVADQFRQASMAAQSAVQMYQAASLLATASGFGSFIALSGMLGGAGGVGLLASTFGDGGGRDRTEEVMAAIEKLESRMMHEFGNVNAKLEMVLTQLQAVIKEIVEARATLDTVLGMLRTANAQISLVLQRINEVTFDSVDVEFQNRQAYCRNKLLERSHTKGSVEDCRHKLTPYAQAMTKGPFQYGGSSDAHQVLRDTFHEPPGRNQAPNGPGNYWHSAAAYKAVAVSAYGLPDPGTAAYEPGLVALLKLLADLKGQYKQHFPANDATVQGTRAVLQQHFAFKSHLRTSTSNVYRVVATRYAKQIDALEAQCRERVATRVVALLEADKVLSGWPAVKVRNASGVATHAAQTVVRPESVSADGAQGKIHPAYFRSPHLTEFRSRAKEPPLTVLAIRFAGRQISGLQGSSPQDFVEMSAVVTYKYEELDLGTYTLALPNRRLIGPDVLTTEQWSRTQSDPAYGLSIFGFPQAQEKLAQISPAYLATVIDLQRRKVMLNPRALLNKEGWKALAEAPELGGTGGPGKSLPALSELNKLGDFLRAHCLLAHPESAADCDALMALFYGSSEKRLPDTDALNGWLQGSVLPDRVEKMTVTLPFDDYMRRVNSLQLVLRDVERSQQDRGLAFEVYDAVSEYERQFRTTGA